MRNWMTRASLALVAVAALSACGDQRLAKLHTGMPADSVATVFGADAPHRTLTYLTAGRQWEVRLYAVKAAAEADSVEWRKLSPVVLNDGKVIAYGWGAWDKLAAKLSIPVPAK
ncbi:MAG: hypothetical protein V4558_15285 [Gemmatimonadota bacterium]